MGKSDENGTGRLSPANARVDFQFYSRTQAVRWAFVANGVRGRNDLPANLIAQITEQLVHRHIALSRLDPRPAV